MSDKQQSLYPDAPVPEDALAYLAERRDDDGQGKRGLKELVELIDVVADALAREQGEAHSEAYAVTAVRAIARCRGGRMAYLPTGKALDDALRNRAIWEAHNQRPTRDTVLELAQQFCLTETRVYQILDEQRRLYIARVQPRLFD
ncbi:MAG: hypothetical protein M0Q49_02095 [Porticoccaceae bacterium]|jgi:Mor family transcriptional regulator|nr:hypothetical protein [Porticoccaceae bacterium]